MEGGEAKFNGRDWNTTPPGLVPVWIEGISKEKCRNLKRSKGSRCELLEWGNAFPVESCSRLAISRNKTSTRIPCFLLHVCPREPCTKNRRKNHQLWVVEENMFRHCWFSKLLPCVWTTNWRSLALAAPQCYVALILLSPLSAQGKLLGFSTTIGWIFS